MSEEKYRQPRLMKQSDVWKQMLAQPEDLERLIRMSIAGGNTLRGVARNIDIPFMWLYEHITGDPALNKIYEAALAQRSEYMKQFLFDQFKLLAESDLSQIFGDDGAMLPVKEWPEAVRQFVSSVEVDELFEGTGRDRIKIGHTKKVKLWDKMKALEQLAKHLNFVVDKKADDSGKLSWEAIILLSMRREGEASAIRKEVSEVEPVSNAKPSERPQWQQNFLKDFKKRWAHLPPEILNNLFISEAKRLDKLSK